jgi:hypothetical protein
MASSASAMGLPASASAASSIHRQSVPMVSCQPNPAPRPHPLTEPNPAPPPHPLTEPNPAPRPHPSGACVHPHTSPTFPTTSGPSSTCHPPAPRCARTQATASRSLLLVHTASAATASHPRVPALAWPAPTPPPRPYQVTPCSRSPPPVRAATALCRGPPRPRLRAGVQHATCVCASALGPSLGPHSPVALA